MSHYVRGLEFRELAKETTYIYYQDFINSLFIVKVDFEK